MEKSVRSVVKAISMKKYFGSTAIAAVQIRSYSY